MSGYNFSKRLVADSLLCLSIYCLNKQRCLKKIWCSGNITWSSKNITTGMVGFELNLLNNEKYLRLDYVVTTKKSDKAKNFNYKIPIETTDCHFGGKRYWFKCPMDRNGDPCGKRVAKLYLGGGYFGCRHCYNLTYKSRKESLSFREYPFQEILLWEKIRQIEKTMNKITYKGKPTRKQKQIYRIQKRILSRHIDRDILDKIPFK